MNDVPTGPRGDGGSNPDRRTVVKAAAAAGLLGAAGMGPSAVRAQSPQQQVEDPQPPPGLKPVAAADLRYPVCFQPSVANGVRVLMDYFTALNQRDAGGMADSMHFPFASLEGTDRVVINTVDDFMNHAPPSMNLTEHPERFTDHDSFLKPGCYDVFDGLEVFYPDPISVVMSLAYNRYGSDGKRLLRCEGIYQAYNNDGRWALQQASTIFTPSDLVGIEYPDAVVAAKRLQIDHDLQFLRGVVLPESVPAYPTWRRPPEDTPKVHSQTWRALHSGESRWNYKVKGIKSRIAPDDGQPTPEPDLGQPGRVTDYEEYRDTFIPLGLGPFGFTWGTMADAKVIHQTVDKVHYTCCAARYTATGEFINANYRVSMAIYKYGYWRGGGSMSYTMVHDRANNAV